MVVRDEGHRFGVVQLGRRRQDVGGCHGHAIGISPNEIEGHHTVAGFDAGTLRRRAHHSGCLDSGDEGWLHLQLILALGHQVVGEADPGGLDVDHDDIGPGSRGFHIGVHQPFRAR
ncbi:Uncharacterised protein [Mycobacteroides abscessus subsp. massiliense]|nr:Uncharacterised protein [Mycobacteroides abscessus subsp. massiliense]